MFFTRTAREVLFTRRRVPLRYCRLTQVSVSQDVTVNSGPDGGRGEVVAKSNDGCDLFEMFGNV